jgi:hypothetical protein
MELGFEPVRFGNHEMMRRGTVTVPLPNPHHGDVSVGLIVRILREAGITREEWLS